MSAAPAQNIHVQLVRLGQEQVGLVGDESEALEEPNAEAAVGDDLGQGEGGGLDVIAALDDLEVRRDRSQVLVRVLVGQVSEAERLADLAGGEELLELWMVLASARPSKHVAVGDYLGGNVKRPVGDVKIPYNENEESHGVSLAPGEK